MQANLKTEMERDSFLGWRTWLVVFDYILSIIAHRMWGLKRQNPISPAHCFWWHVQSTDWASGEGRANWRLPTLRTSEPPPSYRHGPLTCPLQPACSCHMCHLSDWAMGVGWGQDHLFSGQEASVAAERVWWYLWGVVGHRAIQVTEKPVPQGFSTCHCAGWLHGHWMALPKQADSRGNLRERESEREGSAAPAGKNAAEPKIRNTFIKNVFTNL